MTDPRPYKVTWDGHLTTFEDVDSAYLFLATLRVQGYLPLLVYAPVGREDEAYAVPEVPL